jgi:hypothetical protein
VRGAFFTVFFFVRRWIFDERFLRAMISSGF